MVTVQVAAGNLAAVAADAVVVNLFEGVTAPGGGTGAVDDALGGQVSALIEDGAITGKSGELTTLFTFGRIPARRVVVAGLGKQKDFSIDSVRALSANVARALRKDGVRRAATIVHGAGIAGLARRWASTASTATRSRTRTRKNWKNLSWWSTTPPSWTRSTGALPAA
jgi:leucyl aminopeptidase